MTSDKHAIALVGCMDCVSLHWCVWLSNLACIESPHLCPGRVSLLTHLSNTCWTYYVAKSMLHPWPMGAGAEGWQGAGGAWRLLSRR